MMMLMRYYGCVCEGCSHRSDDAQQVGCGMVWLGCIQRAFTIRRRVDAMSRTVAWARDEMGQGRMRSVKGSASHVE